MSIEKIILKGRKQRYEENLRRKFGVNWKQLARKSEIVISSKF